MQQTQMQTQKIKLKQIQIQKQKKKMIKVIKKIKKIIIPMFLPAWKQQMGLIKNLSGQQVY